MPASTRPLPAFPYLDWPEQLQERERRGKTEDFDRAWFVAGNARRAAEGRVSRCSYYLSKAGLSQLAALRNYEQTLKELEIRYEQYFAGVEKREPMRDREVLTLQASDVIAEANLNRPGHQVVILGADDLHVDEPALLPLLGIQPGLAM